MDTKSPDPVASYVLYGEFRAPVGGDFVHVERIADRSALYEWAISPHMHPGIFQVLILKRGESVLITEAAQMPLVPPCLVTVPGGSVHAFRFAPSAEGWVLSVADALLNDPAVHTPALDRLLRGGEVQWASLADPAVSALFDAVLELLSRPDGATGRLGYAGVSLLLAALERMATLTRAPTRSPDRRLQLARRFGLLVDAHFREHWPVARYASELGATPQSLTRACQFVLGKAPGDAVHERMMREAMRALAFSAAGIGEIAEHLGFSDPAYFSRFFKQRAGMEPSRFRRERAWSGEGRAP